MEQEYLTWLRQYMEHRKLDVFYIEDLQPDALGKGALRDLYRIEIFLFLGVMIPVTTIKITEDMSAFIALTILKICVAFITGFFAASISFEAPIVPKRYVWKFPNVKRYRLLMLIVIAELTIIPIIAILLASEPSEVTLEIYLLFVLSMQLMFVGPLIFILLIAGIDFELIQKDNIPNGATFRGLIHSIKMALVLFTIISILFPVSISILLFQHADPLSTFEYLFKGFL